MCSRAVLDCFCSPDYLRLPQEQWWRSLNYGKHCRSRWTRGLTSHWEHSAPHLQCLDLAPGQTMLGCSEGSASRFQLERGNFNQTLEGDRRLKRVGKKPNIVAPRLHLGYRTSGAGSIILDKNERI